MGPPALHMDDTLTAPRAPFLGSRTSSYTSSPQKELPGFDFNGPPRPPRSRAGTNDSLGRPGISRAGTAIDSPVRQTPTYVLRSRAASGADVFSDPEDGSDVPELSYDGELSSSPVTSSGLASLSRNTSYSALDNPTGLLAKVRPPPPPSRSSKPPPPPPPMKRSALSSSQIPRV